MAIAILTPRTQVTTRPEVSITDRIVLQPHTWYTTPTGKKAFVKGFCQCTGRGAASTTALVIAGINYYRVDRDTVLTNWSPEAQPLRSHVDFKAFFESELAAGETVVTNQNSGTNAEWNIWGSVLELPA